jgi:hypothetical protein
VSGEVIIASYYTLDATTARKVQETLLFFGNGDEDGFGRAQSLGDIDTEEAILVGGLCLT